MKRTLSFITLLLLTTGCYAQTLNDTIASLNKAMDIYLSKKPGAQLSIQKNGNVFFSKAYGMADMEHDVPLSMNSKMEAGSVSKQFTAAAILLLEQQGKLSLSDPLKKYIPEMPDYGKVITLEQMMHHTSGIKDWGTIAAMTGWGRFTKNYTNDDALEIIVRQKTLNNVPGAEYIYSNSNYNLLAIIVERVSKKSLQEFTKEHIFIPAGMLNTEWRDNHNKVVKNRAIAYRLTESGYETEMPEEDCYGNGGLLTTAEDLLKWTQFIHAKKFGNPSLLLKQTTTERFNNGKMNSYAAGLIISEIKGNKVVMHDGATASYRCFLEHYPDLNISISFLSNSSEFDTAKVRLAGKIRDILLPNKATVPEKMEARISSPKNIINTYLGWYKHDRNGVGAKLMVKDSTLTLDNTVLVPQSENRFAIAGGRFIEFQSTKKKFYLTSQTDTVSFSQVETPIVNALYLKRYLGKYFSSETGSFLTVTLKGDLLMLNIKINNEYKLTPTYSDAFNIIDFGGNLYFIKDKYGKVTGMKLSAGRARNVEFMKVE